MPPEQARQGIHHIFMVEFAGDPTAQAFTRIFVDDVQNAVRYTVMGPVLHEVIGPDVVGSFRPETNAGAIHCPAGHCKAMSRERQASNAELSREIGINVKTFSKWRKRQTVALRVSARRCRCLPRSRHGERSRY